MQSIKDLKFQPELLTSIREEIELLAIDHWNEVQEHKDLFVFDIDWETYEAIESTGNLGTFTIRNKEDTLVGYFTCIASPHIHTKTVTVAVSDTVYIMPAYRKGHTASKFLDYVQEQMTNLGVDVLVINAKKDSGFEKVLSRKDFEPLETVYSKVLRRT